MKLLVVLLLVTSTCLAQVPCPVPCNDYCAAITACVDDVLAKKKLIQSLQDKAQIQDQLLALRDARIVTLDGELKECTAAECQPPYSWITLTLAGVTILAIGFVGGVLVDHMGP